MHTRFAAPRFGEGPLQLETRNPSSGGRWSCAPLNLLRDLGVLAGNRRKCRRPRRGRSPAWPPRREPPASGVLGTTVWVFARHGLQVEGVGMGAPGLAVHPHGVGQHPRQRQLVSVDTAARCSTRFGAGTVVAPPLKELPTPASRYELPPDTETATSSRRPCFSSQSPSNRWSWSRAGPGQGRGGYRAVAEGVRHGDRCKGGLVRGWA
jgi:hypothetical protein